LCVFGSLCVCHGGCPVDCCLPLVLVFVTGPSRCGSFMHEGNTLMGLGCPAKGTDGGGNRLFRGSLRGGQVALRRCKPLADCGRGRAALVLCLQFVDAHVDSANALPYLLLAAALRGPWLAVHASSMPGPGQRGHAWMLLG
jgi:hypothetical protein